MAKQDEIDSCGSTIRRIDRSFRNNARAATMTYIIWFGLELGFIVGLGVG